MYFLLPSVLVLSDTSVRQRQRQRGIVVSSGGTSFFLVILDCLLGKEELFRCIVRKSVIILLPFMAD